jgi:heterodisulfide reductase subunit A-like polyferredoxin
MSQPNSTNIGAVLMVGAGISGMQSALDLANGGFKVFLVDKNISIGGVMAQLDKTFPTNDCSTCMISPKLIEVAGNPNIEVMTRTRVTGISGKTDQGFLHGRAGINRRPAPK